MLRFGRVRPARTPSIARSQPALLVPALVVGAGVTVLAVSGFFLRDSQADFTMFYDSGRAWNAGRSPYAAAHANLNPPSVVAAVFAPLAQLRYGSAQVVWFAAGAAALIASVRLIARELALTRQQVLRTIAPVSLTYPWFLLWFGGQVTFLLMFPFTKAWLALRGGRHLRAGAWLALVIAFKPPFALAAMLLPPRVWATAGVSSAALSGLGVLWTGWTPWQEWLRLGRDVTWLSWADNASLWGVVSRARSGWLGGGALSEVPAAAMAVLVTIALAGAVRVVRQADTDRRLSLAILWMLLSTPLGWVYYVLIGLGPLRASWPGTPLAWAALALLTVPLPLVYPLVVDRWTAATLGSVYAAALLCAWASFSAVPPDFRNRPPDLSRP